MIHLPPKPCPPWLLQLDAATVERGPGDWAQQLLADAFFCPGEMEGNLTPLRLLHGQVHSFVYLGFTAALWAKKLGLEGRSVLGHAQVAIRRFDPLDCLNAWGVAVPEGADPYLPGQEGVWVVLESPACPGAPLGCRISVLGLPFDGYRTGLEALYRGRGISPAAVLAYDGMACAGWSETQQAMERQGMRSPEWLITRARHVAEGELAVWDRGYRQVGRVRAGEPFSEAWGVFRR